MMSFPFGVYDKKNLSFVIYKKDIVNNIEEGFTERILAISNNVNKKIGSSLFYLFFLP